VLIEYKITIGASGVTISQRVTPGNNSNPPPGIESAPDAAIWKSLGQSFFEAPHGGGGTDPMGPPGGGGTDPMGPPGGGGTDPMAPPGGGGTESTAPPGGGGTESTAPPGGESPALPAEVGGSRPIIIFGPIVMMG
jgi:hypothetical protein